VTAISQWRQGAREPDHGCIASVTPTHDLTRHSAAYRQYVSVPRRVRRLVTLGGVLSLLLIGGYVVAFVAQFSILGPPVRDEAHGWLGPTPRGSSCVRDIGKVNEWTCDDIGVFQRYRLGSRVWLWANGF
jgi:hypothetical protein